MLWKKHAYTLAADPVAMLHFLKKVVQKFSSVRFFLGLVEEEFLLLYHANRIYQKLVFESAFLEDSFLVISEENKHS